VLQVWDEVKMANQNPKRWDRCNTRITVYKSLSIKDIVALGLGWGKDGQPGPEAVGDREDYRLHVAWAVRPGETGLHGRLWEGEGRANMQLQSKRLSDMLCTHFQGFNRDSWRFNKGFLTLSKYLKLKWKEIIIITLYLSWQCFELLFWPLDFCLMWRRKTKVYLIVKTWVK